MPVISTATSVSITPTVTGQRGYYQKQFSFDQRQKVWVNIQDTSVTINVFETIDEFSYTVDKILFDSTATNGFSTSTTITFSPPDDVTGTRLVAEPVIVDGYITEINVVTTGTGYVYAPTVTINDPVNPGMSNTHVLVSTMHDPASGVPITNTYLRGSITIPLSRFLTLPSLDNQTLWAFETEFVTIKQNKKPESSYLDLSVFTYLDRISLQPFDREFKLWYFKRPYNVFNESVRYKGTNLEGPEVQIAGNKQPPLFYFFVHDKNLSSWNDVSWRFNYGTETADPFLIGPSSTSFKESVADLSDVTSLIETIYLKIPDEDITAGNPVPVEVHTSSFVDYVYVEQVCGIPDRVKVKLTNGVGKFNILTTGLEAGDVASAKVGFKYWVNIETVNKTLV